MGGLPGLGRTGYGGIITYRSPGQPISIDYTWSMPTSGDTATSGYGYLSPVQAIFAEATPLIEIGEDSQGLGIIDQQNISILQEMYPTLTRSEIVGAYNKVIDDRYGTGPGYLFPNGFPNPAGGRAQYASDDLLDPDTHPELYHALDGIVHPATNSLDTALSAAQGWTRHDPGGASGGGGGGSGGSGGSHSASGGGVNPSTGQVDAPPGTGGSGSEANHSLGSPTGYSDRGVYDLEGPEAGAAGAPGRGWDGGLGLDAGIQPIILDLDGDGVEGNAANGGWAREVPGLAA